jgi:hypothetical protein
MHKLIQKKIHAAAPERAACNELSENRTIMLRIYTNVASWLFFLKVAISQQTLSPISSYFTTHLADPAALHAVSWALQSPTEPAKAPEFTALAQALF